MQQPFITTNNSMQNLGSAENTKVNMVGNLSVENPTVEQLNAAIASAQVIEVDHDEPAFGEHVREAAGVIRRLLPSK